MKLPRPLGMLVCMDRWMRFAAVLGITLGLAACAATRRTVVVEPSADAAVRPAAAPQARALAGKTYRVVHGDTLYAIAFRHGLDFRDLAAWNRIAPPYTIRSGELLRLSPEHGASAPTAVAVAVAPRSLHAPAARPTSPVFEPVKPATAPSSSVAVPVAGVPTPAASAPAPVPQGASRTVGAVAWRWPANGSLIKKFHSGDAIPGIELAGKAGDPVRAAADGVVVYSGNGLVGYGELIIIKHSDSFLSAYGHNRKRLVKEGQRVSAGQLIAEIGSTGASRDELEFQIRRDGTPVDPLDYLPPR
jgi:lipoprotein NlpD